MARKFRDLSERELLALAISLEEEDGRIYGDFADGLREDYGDTAKLFDEMREEESQHRTQLIETYRERFGEHIPLIRRQDVQGFVNRRPVWLMRPLPIKEVRKQVEVMELETRRVYERAMRQVTDAGIRKLLGDLADAERKHYATAESLQERITPAIEEKEEDAQRRLFVLQVVQPGLAGLDGRIGFNLGPGIRGRVCDEKQLGCFPRWNGGFDRRGHFDGVCRSAFRRRVAYWPRASDPARSCYRADDRPPAALVIRCHF